MENAIKQQKSYQYQTQCELDNLTKIQYEIELLMQDWYDDDIKLNFTTLSIVEVLANIFEHSFDQTSTEKQDIYLTICKESQLISVMVIDNGRSMPPEILAVMSGDQLQMPDIDVNVTDLPDSGWGLNLVQHATKAVNYNRENDTNYLELVFDTGVDK